MPPCGPIVDKHPTAINEASRTARPMTEARIAVTGRRRRRTAFRPDGGRHDVGTRNAGGRGGSAGPAHSPAGTHVDVAGDHTMAGARVPGGASTRDDVFVGSGV